MVERAFRIREVTGSMPVSSNLFEHDHKRAMKSHKSRRNSEIHQKQKPPQPAFYRGACKRHPALHMLSCPDLPRP